MNMSKDGMELTIVIYMEYVLILWLRFQDMEELVTKLMEQFTSLTAEMYDAFTYMGMYLEIDRKGKYSNYMCDYIVKPCESHT